MESPLHNCIDFGSKFSQQNVNIMLAFKGTLDTDFGVHKESVKL